jgi:enamine deaminase RidA (YjgF/YER057c/UK114 family)
VLPPAIPSIANFAPALLDGGLLYLSGQGPRDAAGYRFGKVGADVSADEAREHARLVGLSLLAVIRQELGSLDRVRRVVRLFGMVNATPDFVLHSRVIDGCSDLMCAVFGEEAGPRAIGSGRGLAAGEHHGRNRGRCRGASMSGAEQTPLRFDGDLSGTLMPWDKGCRGRRTDPAGRRGGQALESLAGRPSPAGRGAGRREPGAQQPLDAELCGRARRGAGPARQDHARPGAVRPADARWRVGDYGIDTHQIAGCRGGRASAHLWRTS